MSNNTPPERDVRDFEFVQLCKFRVCAPDQEIPVERGKLLACSSQYGLIVYATKQGFSVVQTAELLAIDESKGKERSRVVVEDIPILASVSLSSPVLYMDVSCDGLFLAVVVRDSDQMGILFYDIRSFADRGTSPAPFARSQVNSSSSAVVCDLSWNPAVPTMLTISTSDGNVELIDVTDTPKVTAVLVAATGATCFCWSPKGKQLLVGRKDGTLVQYDHALAEKKVWPCPNILSGPHRVVDVVWQSTYVFLAAYLPVQAQPSDQPVVIMTSANKDKITNINFEDVCFGNGENRKPQYFFHLIQKWDVILMASSNATETTIVGRNLDDKISWEHWNLEDCSRAELPLTSQQCDSFPMGLVVDYSPHKNIVISESKNLPPCPVMYLLSTDGMLVGYHLFYSHREAVPATTPPLPLTSAGARKGVPELAGAVSSNNRLALLPTPQSAHTAAVTLAAAPQSLPTAAPSPTPVWSVTPTLPAPTSVTVPTPVSAPTAAFSFPTAPASTSSFQLPFSNFTTPSANSSAPVFPFAGLGSKLGTPTSGIANQKPQSHIQTPPAPPSTQSGLSLFSSGNQSLATSGFSFGTKPATTQSSAFANLGSTFSPFPATSAPAKTFSQGLPAPSFGSGSATVAQPQTLFTSGGVTSTSNIFGHSQTSVPTKDEGSRLSPHIATSGPQPTGMSTGQLRPPAPSAFTSKPTPPVQGQAGQSPQMPGNGLVLGNAVRGTSPVLQSTHPGHARPQVSPQPSMTPVIVPSAQLDISTKSIEATVDNAFTQNILEEIMDFERELADLRARSRREVKTVGTREEMQSLRQDKEKMINFTMEIQKVTKEQLREVQEQKDMCFNLLAMAEECQSRHKRDLDPHYHSLLLNRVLDPASAERLKSLQQMSQAIEQSLLEVDHALDAQWQEHLVRRKKEERISTPAGDTIYKSIKNNHIVISTQRQQLEKLEEQLKNLRLYNMSGGDFSSVNILNGDEISSLKPVQKPDVTLNSLIANGMTPEKVSKLREILSQRKVPRVRSTASANLSMSRILRMTPGKSLVAASTPQPQLQQQAPQRPQQQRKHQLPQQVQAVPSPLNFQYGTPAAQFQPGIQQQPHKIQQGNTPAKPFSVIDGVQRPASGGPTSFSGLAYFKQQPEGVAASKPSNLTSAVPSHVVVAKGGVGLGIGATPPLSSTPGGRLGSVSSQGQTVTSAPLDSRATNLPVSSVSQSTAQRPDMYESITPTETEEEDDDYDEEDNGYEDEEEEEDEEEAGFDVISSGPQGIPTFGSLAAGGVSNAGAAVSGGGAANSTSGGGIFKLPQTLAAEANVQAFTPLKTAAQTSTAPGGTKPSIGTASTTLAGKDLFGAKSAAAPVFGGPAVFGEKAGPQLPTSGRLFGSQVTPSKTVGFNDLTEKSAPPVGLENLGEDLATSAAPVTSKEATSQSPSSPTSSVSATSPTAAAVSSAASAFSFIQAASGSETPAFGETKPVTTSVFGNPAALGASPSTSVFGGKSPSEGSTFSFGTTPSTSATPETKPVTTSVFGNPAALGASPSTSVFGGKSPSEGSTFSFGTTPSTSATPGFSFGTAANAQASNAKPVFGAAAATASSAAATPTSASSSQPSIKIERGVDNSGGADNPSEDSAAAGTGAEAPVTRGSVWGVVAAQGMSQDVSVTTTISAVSEPTTAAPVFGAASSMSAPSSDSSQPGASPAFGGGTTVVSSSSVFGSSPAKEVASAPSVFGGTSSSTSATPVFGTEAATSTTAAGSTFVTTSSVFGGGTTSAASLFGKSSTTTPSIFGGSLTTTASSLFGTGPATTASSIFGQGPPTTASSIFGSGATSIFGGAGGASSPSIFGGGSTTAASLFSGAGTSVFGGTSTTKSDSLFSNTTTPSAPAFGFGTGTNSAAAPVFGTSSPLASSGSGAFGGGGGSSGGLFGSGSTTVAPSASTGLFGTTPLPTSAFGSSAPTSQQGSIFGQPTTSNAFGFGQPSNAAGGSTPFGQSSAFGQQPSSSSSGSLFGFGGLGGKPSEEKAKLNVFGTPQVFGSAPSQNNNLFGSGGSSTFGDANSSSNFSSNTGRFSAPAGGVATSGFGVTVSQQSSGGFGGTPAFGSAPSFGGTAVFGSKVSGFGSSPSFGGSPTFGAAPAFSSPAGSSSTAAGFSSFASAAAPSFGQLAQSSPAASPFGGGGGGGGGFGSSSQTQSSPFGGGFGSTQPSFGSGSSQQSFGSGSLFGQATASPGFAAGQTQGFGSSPSFGSNPAFSSYRG